MFIKIKKLKFLLIEHNTVSMCELLAWVKLIITKLLDSSIVRYKLLQLPCVQHGNSIQRLCTHSPHDSLSS